MYDLYKIDLGSNNVTKLWDIAWKEEKVVPVREMIVIDTAKFYTLCYPEHFSKSYLKLYRFSIKDGSRTILGDSIPILSDKIKTNANIYYSKNLNKLFAVVQEFDNRDIASDIKIYSLDFPPITEEALFRHDYAENTHWGIKEILLFVFIVLTVVAGGIGLFYRNKKRKMLLDNERFLDFSQDARKMTKHEIPEIKPNSILLFGDFRIQSFKNKDITYLFSHKLKLAFLIILEHSRLGGIASQHFSSIMWPEKEEDKSKNLRGVIINHLRNIFKEMEGVELIYDKGFFKIEIDPNLCYCDYARCHEIMNSSSTNKEKKDEIVQILSRGKFLKLADEPCIDSLKDSTEKLLVPFLLTEMEKSFCANDYHVVLILCDALFNIDPINNEALYYTVQSLTKMNFTNEARRQFYLFSTEFEKIMGCSYKTSYNDIVNGKIKTAK